MALEFLKIANEIFQAISKRYIFDCIKYPRSFQYNLLKQV